MAEIKIQKYGERRLYGNWQLYRGHISVATVLKIVSYTTMQR